MNFTSFKRYLEDINVSEITQKRIEEIYDSIRQLYETVEIEDIFVCDFNNNGNKEFTSLWFFTNNQIIECKNFMTKEDFDLTGLKKNVIYFNLKKANFDKWDAPEDNSSINIDILFNSGKLSGNLNSSGKNCKYAVDIAKKYFLPNMICTI